MIFKLPYSWLKEYVNVPKNSRTLAATLSLHGVSIDRIEHSRHEFSKVIVAEIIKIVPHGNADKLQIATVTTGRGGVRQIVCGATNIAVGQKVPLALPGAVLPGGVVIESRSVRGVQSDGMLCAASELGLREHDRTILVLHPGARLGEPITADGVTEDDILEVEPTTNRPDIASVVGVAREVSAITGKPLKLPKVSRAAGKGSLPLHIRVLDRKRCQRFSAAFVAGVKVGSSPFWMQERLMRAGVRPINSIVDITNYVMLEFGQPLHAFDADALRGDLVIRSAKKGESILTLDGRTHTLNGGELVNADNHGPVDIAGIMGGELSGVTNKTTNVLFEAATWDPITVRKTSRLLQLSSDASRLFEKGLSTEAPPIALARAVDLCFSISGGKQRGSMFDLKGPAKRALTIKFPLSEISRVLGITIPAATVNQLLRRLGFGVKKSGTMFVVSVPYWRDHDVAGPEDLVEEVARLYGYHNIDGLLPPPVISRGLGGDQLDTETRLKEHLLAMGFTETYSYSLISKKMLDALQVKEFAALKISNPLNNELVYMRPSLLASLVQIVEKNLANREAFKIFEMATVYIPGKKSKEIIDSYRHEEVRLSGVVILPGKPEDRYRAVRGVIESLIQEHGIAVTFRERAPYPFAEGASVVVEIDGREVGSLGILAPAFLKPLGVTAQIAAFELLVGPIVTRVGQVPFIALPKFPEVKRDISLVVPDDIRYSDIVDLLRHSSPLLERVELFDIYRGSQLGEGKQSYSLHLTLRAADRTLNATEVQEVEESIGKALSKSNIIIRQ
ncbi:MAG: phenylalanine--tRNA ligase subunit beta [Patescibacteria group bacterium]|jgi:phenylalanyl-tRNA synthetase beta chain